MSSFLFSSLNSVLCNTIIANTILNVCNTADMYCPTSGVIIISYRLSLLVQILALQRGLVPLFPFVVYIYVFYIILWAILLVSPTVLLT